MTDGDALRQAVVAAPDDDTPRLIYADWLEEHAQPERAAFVRAQVEAARAEPWSLAHRDAERRADQLLAANRLHWTRHVKGLVREPRFRRGFVEHVAIDGYLFEKATSSIFAVEPIQSLRLVRPIVDDDFVRPADIDTLSLLPALHSPRLRQLRRLELREAQYGFSHDEYRALLNCPHLSGVRTLALSGSAIHQPNWLVDLFQSDAFPELEGLEVADITNLGIGLRNALTKTHRTLRSLDATGVFFESDLLRRILDSRCLQDVEELRLGFDTRGSQGPLFQLDIGWVVPWRRLRVLDLAGQHLGDDPVRAIAEQPEAAALRWLGLADNELTQDSIALLRKAQHLSLYYLDLRGNGFTTAAVASLQERFPGALILR